MTFDLLIPAKDASRVTLDKVGAELGYNPIVMEGPSCNQNRQRLLEQSKADFCIFSDDTDDGLGDIRVDLERGFVDHDLDVIFFDFMAGHPSAPALLTYTRCRTAHDVLRLGAGPWSIALRREAVVAHAEAMFPDALGCRPGAYELAYLFATIPPDRIAHLPKVGYHWRVSPGGITHSMVGSSHLYRAAHKIAAMEQRVDPLQEIHHLPVE